MLKTPPEQNPIPSEAVYDIVALTKAFIKSIDKIGNLPDYYTIRDDPSVKPVEHAHCKVPVESRAKIKAKLQEMVY